MHLHNNNAGGFAGVVAEEPATEEDLMNEQTVQELLLFRLFSTVQRGQVQVFGLFKEEEVDNNPGLATSHVTHLTASSSLPNVHDEQVQVCFFGSDSAEAFVRGRLQMAHTVAAFAEFSKEQY